MGGVPLLFSSAVLRFSALLRWWGRVACARLLPAPVRSRAAVVAFRDVPSHLFRQRCCGGGGSRLLLLVRV